MGSGGHGIVACRASGSIRRRQRPGVVPWFFCEGAREVALIGEAAGQGDVGERPILPSHHDLGAGDALPRQPGMGRDAGGLAKGAREVADGQAAGFRDRPEVDGLGEIGTDPVLSATKLPGSQAAANGLGRGFEPRIGSQEMGRHRMGQLAADGPGPAIAPIQGFSDTDGEMIQGGVRQHHSVDR